MNYLLAQDKNCIAGDCFNGWGIFEYYVGDIYQGRYEGYFLNGARHGKGKYIYTDKSKYEGNWSLNKPHGFGLRTDKNKSLQYGYWESGKLIKAHEAIQLTECLNGDCSNGEGESIDNLGNQYIGSFKNAHYHGKGEMNYPNGDRYLGEWQNGLFHGEGIFYFNNGHQNKGAFKEGKFITNKMKIWAVIVGISDYSDFQKLNYSTKDAKSVYDFMRSIEGGAVPEDQIELLTDEMASGYNILNTTANLFEKADSNDLIIFYFAGHGKNGAFLPYDYNSQKGNLLYHGLINAVLKDSEAKYKLCVVDACHSGSFDLDSELSYKDYLEAYKNNPDEHLTGIYRSSKNIRDRIEDFYTSFEGIKGGMALLLSSASEEISLEANKLEQGVFSYFFIEALRGKANQKNSDGNYDQIINISELFNYIEQQVRKFTYGFQHPKIYGTFDKKMPICTIKEP